MTNVLLGEGRLEAILEQVTELVCLECGHSGRQPVLARPSGRLCVCECACVCVYVCEGVCVYMFLYVCVYVCESVDVCEGV